MGAQMTQKRARIIAASTTLAFLAACGSAALLPETTLFGPTMESAFALDKTDEPLSSEEILGLAADRPLSLTTDPIDL